MLALDRKLTRDLWQMRTQALAIILIMASGVATFVMSLAMLASMFGTQRQYYEATRFANVFVHVKRAPLHVADRLAEIEGVARVEPRLVVNVTLDVPGLVEPAVGRLISVPERGQPVLNQLHVRQGGWINTPGQGQVLVNEHFAEAHGLAVGDSVSAIINGKLQSLHIVGIALSPEYIIAMNAGDMIPAPERFGVFWMGREELEAAYDMDGAFNDAILTLMPGASEAEVLRRVDLLTERYGGIGAYGRDEQLSHRFVTEEIRQLRSMAFTAPVIFLGVAAFLLNVVFSRMIRTQREQIAVLKAFGYSHLEIGWHYVKLVGVLVVIGLIVGTGLGAWMGHGLASMYAKFYRFPVLQFHLQASVVLSAVGLTIVAAGGGTMGAVLRAMRLPPAEAMRPEPPAVFRRTLFERLGLQRLMSQGSRMVLRKLEREPVKAALSCLGLSLAVAVVVLGNFMNDALDAIIETQFDLAQRQDVTISYVEPSSAQALYDSQHLPGVTEAEPFRAVAVRLRSGPRSERTSIIGLSEVRRLNRLIDANAMAVDVPPRGLLLSAKLAEILAVAPGDMVAVEVMEGQRHTRELPVAALIDDLAGVNAYMDIDAVNRLMGEGNVVTGAYMAVDSDQIEALFTELKQTPGVASIAVKDAALASFDETIAENQRTMQLFNVAFAVVIAFGVVYNTARISLTERERELATMRVLGFTNTEVSAVLLGELAVLTLLAIPVGLLLGCGFAWAAVESFETEMYRIPLVITKQTLGLAAAVTLIASIVSGMVVRSRVDRLDLIGVLKSRE